MLDITDDEHAILREILGNVEPAGALNKRRSDEKETAYWRRIKRGVAIIKALRAKLDEGLTATRIPKFIRVARRCPRCRAEHYHHVEHAVPVPSKATINCAACGHRWLGRITAEEGGRNEVSP